LDVRECLTTKSINRSHLHVDARCDVTREGHDSPRWIYSWRRRKQT
jgi:hypothetical protein